MNVATNLGIQPTVTRHKSAESSAHAKAEIERRYADGIFSDPIKKKNWAGFEVFGHDHKKLIAHLRHECVHLKSVMNNIEKKVNAQDIRSTAQDRLVKELSDALSARNTAFAVLSEELDEANFERRRIETTLIENVSMMHNALTAPDKKRNRLSVLSQIDIEAHEANLGALIKEDKGKQKAIET